MTDIRQCEKGHLSLNAGNWECPWCLNNRQTQEIERLKATLKVTDCANCAEAFSRSFSTEAKLARVVEAGNHLAREVSAQPWQPRQGHLTDAVEMWRSVAAAQPSECRNCPHPKTLHDTGWDAAGCMAKGCNCQSFSAAQPKEERPIWESTGTCGICGKRDCWGHTLVLPKEESR